MNWPGDVAVIPAVAESECSPQDNDRAVRALLKRAKRTGATVSDVAHACAVPGLDLSGALLRARGVRS